MNLKLIREPSVGGATLGALYIEDVFESFTLEDQIRPYPNKVPKQTCIWGDKTYEVVIAFSPKHGRDVPLLLDIELFVGIEIHPGNKIEDTEGCILVGRVKYSETIGESRLAFDALFVKMQNAVAAGERLYIMIVNPVEKLESRGPLAD